MPITYQRLGNSGGGGTVDLKIATYPNTEVTLQNKKTTKKVMSDDSGCAIFNGVKGGKYTVAANGKTKQITVVSEQEECVCEQIKDLTLKSKVKFSNGKKFILMTKNPKQIEGESHAPNVACFVSEYIVDTFTLTRPQTFQESDEWQNEVFKRYEELTWVEKETILPRFVRGSQSYSKPATQTYFYLLSEGETGVSITTIKNEYNLGFTDDASRARKTESGESMGYWLRGGYRDGSRVNLDSITNTGGRFDTEIGGWITFDDLPVTGGIVTACDISLDAYVVLDSDGYYRILGM